MFLMSYVHLERMTFILKCYEISNVYTILHAKHDCVR